MIEIGSWQEMNGKMVCSRVLWRDLDLVEVKKKKMSGGGSFGGETCTVFARKGLGLGGWYDSVV